MIYLISFLGATPWDKLRYQLNLSNDHYIESDYATFALKELLGMMNSEYKKLRIILFGTHASNWRVAEKYFGDNFTKIIIPEVKNNKESAELFKLIIQEIPEGELILDLTHGYRHLPIFLLLSSFMLELIDSNKHKIIHAFYALRSREEKTAKFISINNYLTFLDSIFATELFRKSLHTERLDAITRELETTKQTGEYEEKKFHYLIDALKGIRKFGEELKTGNIRGVILLAKDVYQQINNAKSALESSFPYLIPILEEYSDEVKLIQEQRAKPLWQVISTLANIFLGKELFLTSMLLLRESLITYACHYFSLCSDKSCRNDFCYVQNGPEKYPIRSKVSYHLNDYFKGKKTINENMIPTNELAHFDQFVSLFMDIKEYRNKMAHTFIGQPTGDLTDMKKTVATFIQKVEQIYQKKIDLAAIIQEIEK